MKNSILNRKPGRKAVTKPIFLRIFFCLLLLTGAITGCGSGNGPVFSVQEETVPETETQREQAKPGDAAEEESGEAFDEAESSPEKIPVEPAALYVYVTGSVRNPGVYVLPEGARIMDAAEAAGGLTEEADPDRVNQAAEVRDGMMICFPAKEETKALTEDPAAYVSVGADPRFVREGAAEEGNTAGSGRKININTADAETLMTLNGIGKAKAEAVIAYREEHGSFRSVEEICKVNGIKESVFDRIRESITVE
ncbi:MAG: ComEA family DNA-binding protein [Lachnospiraceae bacterium]|nr:ComEA family DNA-binding protein [Lachnospiraceae bacterium]